MKNLSKIVFVSLVAVVMSLTACSKDEVSPQGPQIVVPEGTQEVTIGEVKELSFMIKVPGGFESYSIQTAGGTFIVPEQAAMIQEGETSGEIIGMFEAGSTAGPGAVTLTVIDQNGKSSTASHALEIIE